MMRRYVIAYSLWLTAVVAMAVVALAWYRHVEQIGLRELKERLRDAPGEPDETGFAPGGKV